MVSQEAALAFAVMAIIMLTIDAIYLSLVGGPPFLRMVARIQGSKPRVRYVPAAATYALMAVGLYHFIIGPGRSVADAFVLGVVIYGVFDGTNMALFSRYSPLIAVQDALWGGILFAVTTYSTRLFMATRR